MRARFGGKLGERRVEQLGLRSRLLLGLAVAGVAWSPAAEAGQITGVTWSSGVASVALAAWSTPDPNNDDFGVGTSPNVLPILQKDYFAIGPVGHAQRAQEEEIADLEGSAFALGRQRLGGQFQIACAGDQGVA